MPPFRQGSLQPATILALVFLAVASLLITPTLGDLGGDSAQYVSLAAGLAEGQGFRDLHLPDAPLHVHYPPGFPLLLAPVAWLAGGTAFVPMKLVVLLAAALGLAGACLLLERRGTRLSAVAAAGLAGTTVVLHVQSVQIQSEAPFFLLLCATLLALEGPDTRRRRWTALLCAAAAFAMRVAGVVPLLVVAIVSLRRRGRRGVGLALAAVVPVLAFSVWTALAGGAGTWSYGSELAAKTGGVSGFAGHLAGGLWFYCKALGALAIHVPWVGTSATLSALVAVPVLLGLVQTVRRGAGPCELCFALMVLLAAAAPMRSFRYLVPVLPLVCFYFLEGLRSVVAPVLRAGGGRLRVEHALAALAGVVALLNLTALGRVVARRFQPRVVAAPVAMRSHLAPAAMHHWVEGWFLGSGEKADRIATAYGSFLQLVAALDVALPHDAVLAARKPRLVSLLAGRPCVGLVDSAAALRDRGVTHLVVDGLFRETRRFVATHAGDLALQPVVRVRSSFCAALGGRATPPPR